MKGNANRAEARQSEGGFLAAAKFRFDTPQLAAGSFIDLKGFFGEPKNPFFFLLGSV